MKLNSSRGTKNVSFYPNELLQYDDLNFVSEAAYTGYAEMVALLSRSTNRRPDADDYDYVMGGLLTSKTSDLTVKVLSGLALSFTGTYYQLSAWGFNASAGDLFTVVVPQDTDIGVSAVSGGYTDSRYDILEIRPVKQTFDSKSRQFRDPITGIVSSVTANTKTEYTFEYNIKQGAAPGGAGTVPTTTPGWIKIAEIIVNHSTSIISAVYDYTKSSMWAGDTNKTLPFGVMTDDGSGNIAVSHRALSSLTTGLCNVAVGENSLCRLQTGCLNVGVGQNTLGCLIDGSSNIAIGNSALCDMVSGFHNVGIGNNALQHRISCHNVGVGSGTIMGCTTKACNTGSENTAVGVSALRCVSSGIGNVAVGYCTGNLLCSGCYNVLMGCFTGCALTSGACNTAMGACAGLCSTTAQNGTFVGSLARSNAINSCYETVIGAGAIGCGGCTVTLGRATDRAYLSDGTCHKTFGTAQNCIPLNNGTVHTCLNSDMLDGKHVGTSGDAVPTLCQANTFACTQTFSAAVILSTQATCTCHAVRAARCITAGTGLSGGGNMTADRTICIPTSGVTAGAYGSTIAAGYLCVNDRGIVTVAASCTIRDASLTQSGVVSTAAQSFCGAKTFSNAVILSTQATCTCHAVQAARCITAGTGLSGGGNLIANRTICIPVSGVTAGAYGSTIAAGYFCVNDRGIITSASSCTIRDASLTQSGVVSTVAQSFCGAKTFAQAVILSTQATCTCHAVQAARCISVGTGLSGGGNMIADRTICIPASGVTAGAYGSTIAAGYFWVNSRGIITSAASCTIRDASSTQSGVVSTASQSFMGFKTFCCNISVHGINVGVGGGALITNVAVGSYALACNSTGNNNNAIGNATLVGNTCGCYNNAVGSYTLSCNSTGSHNNAIGGFALACNSCGRYNNAFGTCALYRISSGCCNIGLGYFSGMSCTTTSAVAFIGAPSACAGCINNIYSKATSITTYSDVNFKHDICEIHEGLELLRHVSPISYYWHNCKDRLCTEKPEIGFGAQCLNQVFCECLSSDVLKRLAHNVVIESEDDNNKSLPQWGVNSGNLIPFMVNAIKELDQRVSALEARV